MESVYLIIKRTPFPPIAGFEAHEYAYYKLRQRWRKFRGEVCDLNHFIIPYTVRELDKAHKLWSLCAEYKDGKLTLLWKEPKDIDKDLLPVKDNNGRVWVEG